MNELQIFNHPDFGEVRTIDDNGTILFCGNDVARMYGYFKPMRKYSNTPGWRQKRKKEIFNPRRKAKRCGNRETN